MIEALDHRHIEYNNTLAYLKDLEQKGIALVIAPESPLPIGRFEKNPENLKKVWQIGYQDAKKQLKKIRSYTEKTFTEELL